MSEQPLPRETSHLCPGAETSTVAWNGCPSVEPSPDNMHKDSRTNIKYSSSEAQKQIEARACSLSRTSSMVEDSLSSESSTIPLKPGKIPKPTPPHLFQIQPHGFMLHQKAPASWDLWSHLVLLRGEKDVEGGRHARCHLTAHVSGADQLEIR